MPTTKFVDDAALQENVAKTKEYVQSQVVTRLEQTNALPVTVTVGKCYLLTAAQTGYELGGTYQGQGVAVTPVGSEDPSSEGWYELDNGEYVLTTDTTVTAGKTYYTLEWVLISAADTGDLQPKTLDTPLTIGGIQETTVEGALDALNVVKMNYTDNSILGAKNVLIYPYYETSKTQNGITWTDNGDGTVTANGTCTSDTTFAMLYNVPLDAFTEDYGTNAYLLTGSPEGGGASTYYMGARYGDYGTHTFISEDVDAGNGIELVYPTAAQEITIRCVVKSGQTVSDLVFKPMIRLATDSDATYRPYAETNKQLTDRPNSFIGTTAEWNALSATQKKQYQLVNLTDDDNSKVYTDTYSTTETLTNKVWIDGKPIYRRVIENTTGSTADVTKQISFSGFANVDVITDAKYLLYYNGSTTNSVITGNYYEDSTYYVCYWITNSNGGLICVKASSNYINKPIKIILEYTKT